METSPAISPEEFLPLLGDWPLAVGRFVMAFSSCEYWTYIYLQQVGSPAIRAELANAKLSARIKVINKLAGERGIPVKVLAQIEEALKTLSRLAHDRNLAAHNSPMAHVYEDPRTGDYSVKIEFRGANRHEAEVTHENLDGWFREAVRLSNQLWLVSMEIGRHLDLRPPAQL